MSDIKKYDRDEDINLHARLLAGDPVASADLCRQHLFPLTQKLKAHFRTTDLDLIHDAVVSALLDYAERPHQYDPSRRSLAGFLYMVASRDLLNLRERHRPRLELENLVDDVGFESLTRNMVVSGGDTVFDIVADHETSEALMVRAESVATTEEERLVIRLMLVGERATGVYADVLGLLTLTEAEQRTHVNAIKDRLSKRLKRLRREFNV